MRRKLAAGNWKMNGLRADLEQLRSLCAAKGGEDTDILICPPALLIAEAAALCRGHSIHIGGQDCHMARSGAHTGDVSAAMLKDAGASAVILGHSERRADKGETNDIVQDKARAAQDAGLMAIICVGESLEERENQTTLDVIRQQIAASVPEGVTGDNTVIAYEPCWAIGTGLTASPEQIGEVHDFIRALLEDRFGSDKGQSVRLLYGGSVKPDNASQIFAVPNVDGALVGGASLKASDFLPIIKALDDAAKPS